MTPSRTLSLLLTLLALAAPARAAELPTNAPPTATLDNGLLHVTLYLPNQTTGFYRGTRFDWSGVIASLTFAGHSFYGPWFDRVDPTVTDFVFRGPEIVASTDSGITGPSEEFLTANDSAVGFDQAAPGATFLKIGVGVLRRPDTQPYSSYRDYQIVDPGHWTIDPHPTSITFTQQVVDPHSGYGYRYTKTVRLLPHQPRLTIDHTLTNLGRQPIATNVFNHNFLIIDHQPTGPDFTITLPYQPQPLHPYKTDLGGIEDNHIVYRKPLIGRDVFSIPLTGFNQTPSDYDIRIDNPHAGAGIRIQGDHPLEKEELWSIRTLIAMEPFVKLEAAPNKTIHWSQTYTYYTIPRIASIVEQVS
jgi:hypothetical protein